MKEKETLDNQKASPKADNGFCQVQQRVRADFKSINWFGLFTVVYVSYSISLLTTVIFLIMLEKNIINIDLSDVLICSIFLYIIVFPVLIFTMREERRKELILDKVLRK